MKGFYGVNSQEDYDRFVGILDDIPKIFSRGYFLGDMLITLLRNMSFLRDPIFRRAFDRNADSEAEQCWQWRLHTLTWAASQAANLRGDFVECGVFRGFMSAAVAEYLDFGRIDKTFLELPTGQGLVVKH